MIIDVGWGQDDRAYLLIEFHEEWEWCDYYAALTQAHKLLDSAIQKTPVIVDFSEALRFPRGVLTHFPAAMKYDHHNRGMMYVVGANSVLIAIGRMGTYLPECHQKRLFTPDPRRCHSADYAVANEVTFSGQLSAFQLVTL